MAQGMRPNGAKTALISIALASNVACAALSACSVDRASSRWRVTASVSPATPNMHDRACGELGERDTKTPVSQHDDEATNADSLGLDHLRSFIAVIETGSQMRAARRLRVAQTTISRHIERIQEHFGGGLFAAGASGPLSTRGKLVEQSVRTAMTELARTRDRLAVERPVLRIGFIRPLRPLLETALRAQAGVRGGPRFDVRLLELTGELQASALTHETLRLLGAGPQRPTYFEVRRQREHVPTEHDEGLWQGVCD